MLSRLGITLTEEEDEALKPVGGLPGEQGDEKGINKLLTANAGAPHTTVAWNVSELATGS